MPNVHPASETLTSFLLGALPWNRTKQIVLHLLSGCDRCRDEMAPMVASILDHRWPEREPSPEEDAAYDAAISEACRRVLETLRRDKKQLPGRQVLENLTRRGREAVTLGRL
jgi:anti-sigma factor ChrR (cupin superfamily)